MKGKRTFIVSSWWQIVKSVRYEKGDPWPAQVVRMEETDGRDPTDSCFLTKSAACIPTDASHAFI